MKIGVPRALMYQYYYPFWLKLFRELGFEVVVSDRTTKALVQPGITATVAEICLPIKIYNAHVINLMEKGVDYIFVPRLTGIEKNFWCCPKYIGLPELVQNSLHIDTVTAEVWVKNEDISGIAPYLSICKKLNIPVSKMKKAVKAADAEWKAFRAICEQGFTISEADAIFYDGVPKERFMYRENPVTIGVLGYVYNVYDPFISMDVVGKVRKMGANVVTFDMLSHKKITKYRPKTDRLIYWTFTDKLYQAAHYMLEDMKVDGLMHVTAFGCGPDSVVGKKIEVDFAGYGKPFMTLRVDEHTGENHMQTRVEAFVDMIKRKKAQEVPEYAKNSFSLHGVRDRV